MDAYEIDVVVQDARWRDVEDLRATSERAVMAAMTRIKPSTFSELSLAFVNDAQMRTLNKQYRQSDTPTNVLSFQASNGAGFSPVLGDIVLAYETIDTEAQAQNISMTDHITHLVIHGFLHLQGYDHENPHDANIMEALETLVLADLGISNPYANERVL